MRIFTLTASLVFVAISITSLIINGYSETMVFGGVFFGGCALVAIYMNKLDAWSQQHRQKQIKKTYCQIREDHFYFPKGYYFKQGFLKGKKELPYDAIEEIRTNTFPISAKIENNELIFLYGLEKKLIEEVAKTNRIKTVNPQDNWYLLLEEFLDTEFESDHQELTLEKLNAVGINNNEVLKIRTRFKTRMLITTLFSLEWIYYGHFDILKQIFPLTKEKYWWTMEIALKETKGSIKT